MKLYSKILFIGLVLVSITSCKKITDKASLKLKIDTIKGDTYYKSEIFNHKYQSLYGNWSLINVSGGFAGGGHEKNFDFLEIKPFGIYGFVRNDSLVEYGKVVITEQTDSSLLINLVSDSNPGGVMIDPEKYVNFYGQDTLALDAPCCDRYSYNFVRDK